jgi:hypothetical protein
MAIFIENKSTCKACGKVIRSISECYSFPAFVFNPQCRLYRFHDANFHIACLQKDAQAMEAVKMANAFEEAVQPSSRTCFIDGSDIEDPNDHFFVEYLTDDPDNFLFPLTYKHFKISNLRNWDQLPRFRAALEKMNETISIDSRYIYAILDRLRQ